MITPESIERLKNQLDIVDVIGTYLELKKNGANFKAPCPFHNEKTASFVVSPQKQIFHCFGCGIGGDSIKFVMEYEKLSYPEALEKLAQTYNFTLSYTTSNNNKPKTAVMEKLNEWYQNLLTHNKEALSYLTNRGVYESSIEKFGIGYAPKSYESINYIKSQQFNINEAIECGVIGFSQENNQTYARFIERITFPIYSQNGSLVGFGGRTITGHNAKYVNSPETKFFNKSKLLYAYHLARQSIYKKEEMIVTEGYLDVVMLHQAGFDNAVATLGTALTNEHLPLLRKGSPKIIMAYDGDKAGRAAALKASKLLSASGFDGGVVIFKDGADPADMVQNSKIEILSNMFRKPKPFIEFVLDEILLSYDLKNPKAKESCMQEGIAYLKTLSVILQEEYRVYFASRLGISPSFLRLNTGGNFEQRIPMQQSSHKDMWELSIIKTILEHPEFIEHILDIIDPKMFQFHSREFILALEQKNDTMELMAILIDESIKGLKNLEALNSELITFLSKYYDKELKKLSYASNISFEEKAFLIRKFRDKIARLKKGELVSVRPQ